MTYTFTHQPDPRILRRDLHAARARMRPNPAPGVRFAATCTGIAARFRTMAQAAYDDGDQRHGDYWTARGLAWEMAARSGDLEDVRP